MVTTSPMIPVDDWMTPEESLKRYIADALRRSGSLPLQYLSIEARDGHVYLAARVPLEFLSRSSGTRLTEQTPYVRLPR